MKRTILLGTILISSFAAASAANVAGTWHITGSVADNPVKTTCVFTQKDDTLTGTCTRKDDDKATALTGTVKDQAIEWKYNSEYNGDPITVNYEGTLGKDGAISGTINVDPYNATGDFTAAKD